MIKLKNILIKEEMSPREKREFEAAVRGIETNISFISQEANRLIKLLNKQGLKKSSGEINKSFKKHILEFQKDINNISVQHLQEAFPPSSLGSSTYSNKEAMRHSIDSVNKAAKLIGQAQNKAISIFTSDMKQGKYDRIDLSRSIHKGNIRDASKSKREVLMSLFYDLKDRFVKYGRRKKN
tara:strand:+ start:22 stop:564 length:543 start_codon:yes stop_codon:yes gene_type:complete